MSITKNQQRRLPANRVRIEVRSVDGQVLAPTTPRSARIFAKNGVAVFHRDDSTGHRWLQMKQPCGNVLPAVIVPPGTVLP